MNKDAESPFEAKKKLSSAPIMELRTTDNKGHFI